MNNTTTTEQRKADKHTLVGLSATLSNILDRHKAGEPVLASMAANIDARHAAHMGGECSPDSCPMCLGTGLTMEDIESANF